MANPEAENFQKSPVSPGYIYDSPEKGNAANAIAKVNYNHLDMIDTIIANPAISHEELSLRYGLSRPWISRVIASDAFRTKFAERRGELIDPGVMAETEERFRGLLNRSLDILQEKIETANLDGLIKITEVTSRALSYGVAKNVVNNDNRKFVVALPEKEKSSQSWAEKYGSPVIEVSPSV